MYGVTAASRMSGVHPETLRAWERRYEAIRPRIDRMTAGSSNVLTAEDPVLFAQTSGTTGQPKFIPVTPTCRSGRSRGPSSWMPTTISC